MRAAIDSWSSPPPAAAQKFAAPSPSPLPTGGVQGGAPAMAAADCPSPPYPPCDGVDLSHIDTPWKAALLPTLNGSVLSMLYGSLNQGTPMAAADFTMELGGCGSPSQVHYDINSQGVPLRGSGTVAGQVFNESWVPSVDGGYDVTGQIGTTPERLHVHSDFNFWYMDGFAGDVEVHQRGFIVTGPSYTQRYVLNGTLGGQPYHSELYRYNAGFTTYGYLGNGGTASNYTSTLSDDGTYYTVTGNGVQAGVNYALQATLSLTSPASPPPSPVVPWQPAPPAGSQTSPPNQATVDLAHWRESHGMLTDAERAAQKK